jgi:hypothetical protein
MTKRIVLAIIALILIVFVLFNVRTLGEGVYYLRNFAAYTPVPISRLNPTGRYASLFDLVGLRNSGRLDYVRTRLNLSGVMVTTIPIPDSQFPNLFVQFKGATGPYTIFSAHYDKLRDDPTYQGASDNSAAVSVLLASVLDIAALGKPDNRAFLFTGEEETGLRGAKSFVAYANANKIPIRAIINFDNLGRGRLAIRPSASVPGFIFTLPLLGDFAYDGRGFSPSPPYPIANQRLTEELLRLQPNIVVYERFTALSDSNVFESNHIDTVTISGDDMYYLEQTWHTNADRVELIDASNLDRALDLIKVSK